MQSTSARTSKIVPDQYAVNTDETIKSHSDFIPDISSPSSFTQSVFQTLNDSEVAQQTLSNSDKTTTLKCILLGDSDVGKSSLVISYTSNGFPDHHKSTAFDIYKVEINVEDRRVQLQICDTGGGDEVASLRFLAYPDCHTFILCFSVIQPSSFYNLMNHWIKEIESYTSANNSVILLVGCRCDERNNVSHILDLSAQGKGPITESIVRQYADKIHADAYVECSALTQKNLKKVFDLAIWYSLRVFDHCVQEEQKIALNRLSQRISNSHKKQKKKTNSHKHDSKTYSNGTGNLKSKNSESDLETKSLWKRFFCLS